MSFYKFKQKIAYKLHALNRHGVHSPFVYDFVEQILNGKYNAGNQASIQSMLPAQLNGKNKQLLQQLISYYHCQKLILWDDKKIQEYIIPSSGGQTLFTSFYQLTIVEHVLDCSPGLLASVDHNSIVVVFNMYASEAHTAAWQFLCKDASVTLSIDLFDAGLLLFSKDFLVKQHFLLKY